MPCRGSSERARIHRPALGPRPPDPRERRPRPRRGGHAAAPGAAARRRGGRGGAAAVDRPPRGGGRRRPGRGREPWRRDPVPRRDAAARARSRGAGARTARATCCGCRRTTLRRSSAGCAAPRATEITPRAHRAAAALGVEVARVTIRDPRTRWGSCSSSGSLSFSWRLVLAPEERPRLRRLARGLPPAGDEPLAALLGPRGPALPRLRGAAPMAGAQRDGAARRAHGLTYQAVTRTAPTATTAQPSRKSDSGGERDGLVAVGVQRATGGATTPSRTRRRGSARSPARPSCAAHLPQQRVPRRLAVARLQRELGAASRSTPGRCRRRGRRRRPCGATGRGSPRGRRPAPMARTPARAPSWCRGARRRRAPHGAPRAPARRPRSAACGRAGRRARSPCSSGRYRWSTGTYVSSRSPV